MTAICSDVMLPLLYRAPETVTGIVITLIAYQVLMLGIGWWASKRNTDSADFYLGGRKLGGLVAALSASASSSSAWSLLGVSGAAFAWGLPAIWLIPATVMGFCINWFLIAPRLSEQSRASGAITLTEFIAGPPGDPARKTIMRLGAAVILFSFTFYIAAQFQAAGKTFASVLEVEQGTAIAIGAAVVLVYVWLGGFWAASVTDSVQGLLMAFSALLLPLLALAAVGGPDVLLASLGTAAGDRASLDRPGQPACRHRLCIWPVRHRPRLPGTTARGEPLYGHPRQAGDPPRAPRGHCLGAASSIPAW